MANVLVQTKKENIELSLILLQIKFHFMTTEDETLQKMFNRSVFLCKSKIMIDKSKMLMSLQRTGNSPLENMDSIFLRSEISMPAW